MAQKSNNKSSIGIIEILLIVFIVLKLIPGTVVNTSWSWWWVLSPLWIPIVIFIVIFLIFLLYKFIMTVGRNEDEK